LGSRFHFSGTFNGGFFVCAAFSLLNTMRGRKLLTRIVIVLVILLVGWTAFISSKQLERNNRIEKEVSQLAKEADKIRRENETLTDRISYFASKDFREQEAKDKLGMKKPEETVLVMKQEPGAEVSEENPLENTERARTESDVLPNYRKWWNLFFQNI